LATCRWCSSTGPGAEARNSIGIVLVAGMAIGTLFTLFVVPVFYLWIAADRRAEHGAAESDGVPAGATDLGHTTPELA
jgi:multidrug efflux pump